ncbi:hypothetical protein [Streptomyces sp. NBC_00154]|uniref:hypothetical protein n=1 Tax=Streptomyces sp. NBC_00154 TaxID=2975670 RepID=UPI002251CA51|nr:hypothetical protein [Streptomyces sp. NBC_00154]MCX5317322.1 hypothetical protein [Streptomyces sp. NBC_00154]
MLGSSTDGLKQADPTDLVIPALTVGDSFPLGRECDQVEFGPVRPHLAHGRVPLRGDVQRIPDRSVHGPAFDDVGRVALRSDPVALGQGVQRRQIGQRTAQAGEKRFAIALHEAVGCDRYLGLSRERAGQRKFGRSGK